MGIVGHTGTIHNKQFAKRRNACNAGAAGVNRQKKKPKVAFGRRIAAAHSHPEPDAIDPSAAAPSRQRPSEGVSSAQIDTAAASGTHRRLQPVLEASKLAVEQETAAQTLAAQQQAAHAQAQAIIAQQQAVQTLAEARSAAQAFAAQQQAAQRKTAQALAEATSAAQAQQQLAAHTRVLVEAQAQAHAQAQANQAQAQRQAAQALVEAQASALAFAAEQQAAETQAAAEAQAQAQAVIAQQQTVYPQVLAQREADCINAQQRTDYDQAQAEHSHVTPVQQDAAQTEVVSQARAVQQQAASSQCLAGGAGAAQPSVYDWQAYSNESPDRPAQGRSDGREVPPGKEDQCQDLPIEISLHSCCCYTFKMYAFGDSEIKPISVIDRSA